MVQVIVVGTFRVQPKSSKNFIYILDTNITVTYIDMYERIALWLALKKSLKRQVLKAE